MHFAHFVRDVCVCVCAFFALRNSWLGQKFFNFNLNFFGANKKKEDSFLLFAVEFHLFVFFFWNRETTHSARIQTQRIADFCASSVFFFLYK